METQLKLSSNRNGGQTGSFFVHKTHENSIFSTKKFAQNRLFLSTKNENEVLCSARLNFMNLL